MTATCDGCAEHTEITYRGDVKLCATCMHDPWQELLEAANDVLADVAGVNMTPAQLRLAWAVDCVDPEERP